MAITLLTAVPVPSNRTKAALSPFKTHLVKPLLATANPQVFLPSNVEAELFAALGDQYAATVMLSNGDGTETVYLYFIDGVLRASRAAQQTYPWAQGTCVVATPSGLDGANGANGANGAAGSKVFVGTANPSNSVGAVGDIAFNTASGDVFEKEAQAWVLKGTFTGASGSAGQDGSVWLSGAGVPASTLGKNTDMYVNTENGDLYKKNNGTWVFITNIKGPQGISGNNAIPGSRWFFGTEDPLPTFGSNIDYYLEIDSGDIWSKDTGAWVKIGTMKGTPGTAGSDGAPGYSQAMDFKLSRVLAEFQSNNAIVMPTDVLLNYNTIEPSSVNPVTTNGVSLPPGAYIMVGSADMFLSFAAATKYLTNYPGYEVYQVAQVYIDAYNAAGQSTGYNWVADFGGFGMSLVSTAMDPTMNNYGDQWRQHAPLHGVVNLPHGGVVQFRVKASYDPAVAHAVNTFTVKVSVLRVQ